MINFSFGLCWAMAVILFSLWYAQPSTPWQPDFNAAFDAFDCQGSLCKTRAVR